jgi:Holliday junction resolvase
MAKKRLNSKAKGNRAELELAKILSKRFGMPFARVGVSSGARPKQVKLDGQAAEIFTGDIVVPKGFRFSIESKAVNASVDLLDQSALLDKFLQQAEVDAKSIGRIPMLCWKRNRKGWIVAVPSQALRFTGEMLPMYHSRYRDWLVCNLEALLATRSPSFWFTIVHVSEEDAS